VPIGTQEFQKVNISYVSYAKVGVIARERK
jgi:hypothetical protein